MFARILKQVALCFVLLMCIPALQATAFSQDDETTQTSDKPPEPSVQHQTPARIAVERNFSEGEQRISEVLHQLTSEPIPEMPLREAMVQISKRHEIPIVLDIPSLEAETLTGDESVRLEAFNIPLRSTLKLMLADVGGVPLSFVIADDVLQITTESRADELFFVRVYDVRPLIGDSSPLELMKTIVDLGHSTWLDSGDGDGTIHAFRGSFIISQTQASHEEIEAVLNLTLKQICENPNSPDWSHYTEQRREDLSQGGGIGLPHPPANSQNSPPAAAQGTGMFFIPAKSL